MLPSLPILGKVKQAFAPSPDKVRLRDVVRELPTSTFKVGNKIRGFMSGLAPSRPVLVEQLQQERQQSLLPREANAMALEVARKKDPTIVGFREGDERAFSVDPFGALGVTKKAVGKTMGKVATKYGKGLAQRIFQAGGDDLLKKSLVNGGEDAVAHALGVDRTRVTVNKFVQAIKGAKPVRKEAAKLASVERGVRAGKGEAALKTARGEEAFAKAKAQLGGELPKPEFEGIRQKITPDEVTDLFEQIRNAPDLLFYEKLNAQAGLEKMLDAGKIPTESELKILKNLYGDDFLKAVLNKRSFNDKLKQGIIEVLNLPRALMASMDLSAPFRQGLVASIHKPKIAVKAFGQMFKYFASEKHLQASTQAIRSRPMARLSERSGLFQGDITGGAVSLSSKEEAFMSNLAGKLDIPIGGGKKIPFVGTLVRASERAFTGFLNKLRADVFDDIAREYIAGGISPKKDPQVFEALGSFVNMATGRGSLGRLDPIAPVANSVFFSPRFIAARVQMLNPAWYLKQPPIVRKEAAKAMVKFVGTGLSILTLAKLGGADVEDDPRSTDFGKIKIGNSRWDIWGGFQQYIRVTAQLITGETKSASSGKVKKLSKKKFPFVSRSEQGLRFVTGKLAPIPALAADLLRGQNLIGEDITFKNETMEKITPLYLQDIMEAVKQGGLGMGIAVGVPALFGVGAQTFKKRKGTGGLPSLPSLPKLPKF